MKGVVWFVHEGRGAAELLCLLPWLQAGHRAAHAGECLITGCQGLLQDPSGSCQWQG